MYLSNINSYNNSRLRNFGSSGSAAQSSENKAESKTESKRYKHFEKLNDDILTLKSMSKAKRQVENSGKMRLFKAIPAITTGLIGTSIALTQPGKLSAKAATGLGFLALVKLASMASDKAVDLFDKKSQNKVQNGELTAIDYIKKRTMVSLGTGLAAAFGGFALMKGAPKALSTVAKPFYDFIQKDTTKLANEINDSKLGTFVENTVEPILKKHPKTANAFGILAPIGAIAGGISAQDKLSDSLSNDFRERTKENYIKGKVIQKIAREQFDKIDAEEV